MKDGLAQTVLKQLRRATLSARMEEFVSMESAIVLLDTLEINVKKLFVVTLVKMEDLVFGLTSANVYLAGKENIVNKLNAPSNVCMAARVWHLMFVRVPMASLERNVKKGCVFLLV